MRHAGRSEPKVFEAYNEALVQLSDEGLKEMYLNFMLIYMGEYTEEVLERCQVDEVQLAHTACRVLHPGRISPRHHHQVTEEVLGFSEMATMRIGQLLDQPRAVRIQSLQESAPARSDPTGAPPRGVPTGACACVASLSLTPAA